MLDPAQSAVILSAIASVLQAAPPAQDHHEITGYVVPAAVYDHTTAGASASSAVTALAPTAVEATNYTSITAKAHIADLLPLVAILMDLSFTPSLVKANGQEDRNAFITTVGTDPAVGGIQLFTTTKGSASVATDTTDPQISPQKIVTQGPAHTLIQRDRPVTTPCKRPHAPLKSWMTQNPQPSWSTSKKRPRPSDLLRSWSRRNCRI